MRVERALGSLWAAGSPLPLALLRVAVCAVILLSPEPERARALAAGPPELWLAPPGVRWLLPVFAALAPHLGLMVRLLQASALLGLVGLWTRLSLAVLGLTFLVTFGGAQLNGAVLHDMHLGWFVLLLLVTPSAEVLSLDAWARHAPLLHAPPSAAAGLGVRLARLLLGVVYFFPGLHKLLEGGLAWASSENLQHQLWLKWFQAGGVVPSPRVDLHPALLQAGGVAVVLFELGFVLGACSRRGLWRGLAAAAGLVFHALTQRFMFIPFASLWACYVVLVEWPRPRALDAPGTLDAPSTPEVAAPWPVLLVGLALLLPALVQGARAETRAWPFACYPTFAQPAPASIADLAVDVQDGAGRWQTLRIGPLPPAGGRPPRAWSAVWELAGLFGSPIDPARLEVFARELMRRQPGLVESHRATRFFVESYAIAPESYGAPPLARRPIDEARR